MYHKSNREDTANQQSLPGEENFEKRQDKCKNKATGEEKKHVVPPAGLVVSGVKPTMPFPSVSPILKNPLNPDQNTPTWPLPILLRLIHKNCGINVGYNAQNTFWVRFEA